MAIHPRTQTLHDPELPELTELLRTEHPKPLEAIVSATGGDLMTATPIQVTWWPGENVTVRYRAQVEGGPLDGHKQFVAKAGNIPSGAIRVEDQDRTVGVWAVPHDPQLPGLASALDQTTAADLLKSLGAPSTAASTRLYSYRPGKRAVVSVDGDNHDVFLKVVKPKKSEHLHQSHRNLEGHVRVPRSLGIDRRLGIVALETLPGATMRDALEDPTAEVPDPNEIVSLGDLLPIPGKKAKATSALDRISDLSLLLMRLLPEHTGRMVRLLDLIGDEESPADTVVHGDFYEGQIMVEDGRVSGMLDIDTFGWGRPADDAATMLGHLAVWASLSSAPERVNRYGADLLRIWEGRVDPVDLRKRISAVILGLATGPFRVQLKNWPEETLDRIILAERWAENAHKLDETSLMTASR